MIIIHLLQLVVLGIVAMTTTASSLSADQQQQQVVTVPITRSSTSLSKRHSRFRRNRALAAATKKVPLYNENDNVYLIIATLPDKSTYRLQIDTGSSDTWFRGGDCITNDDGSCIGNSVSTDPLSPGLVDLKLSYFDIYGTGYAVGEVYKTAVTIGGIASTMAIGVTSIEYDDQGEDGLLGLAYASLGDISDQVTPVKNVSGNWFDAASAISTKVFGVYLSSTKNGFTGEITFGGYDTSHYTGKITWLPLVKYSLVGPSAPVSYTSYGFYAFSIAKWTWSIPATSKVRGGKGNLFTTASDPYGPTNLAIADTGTTLMTIPTTPLIAMATALNLAYSNTLKAYPIPCSNSLPPVNFHYGSTTFSIPSSIFTYSLGNDLCSFGIVSGGDGLAIFGDVFTRAYYTFFDKAGHRVGYALAK